MLTSGDVTAATTPATTTGTTIVLVSAAIHVAPMNGPDARQQPRRESQIPQPLRRREDFGQLDRLELDDVRPLIAAGVRGALAVYPSRDPWGHKLRWRTLAGQHEALCGG
jgi:hypothetical protein